MLTLSWDPKLETTGVDAFRKQILVPVLAAIQKRRLSPQIDYIIYSSDFPWGIKLDSDVEKFLAAVRKKDQGDPDKPPAKRRWPKQFTKVGSINGLTYLWQPVLAGSPAYCDLKSNLYMRRPVAEQRGAPTLAFRSTQHFGPKGELLDSKGRRYMLSTMLGVTAGRGNSLQEVLGYLRRSAGADGTHPRGTIYYMRNNNIRSKARHRAFPAAVEQLEKLGVAAEIIKGTVPLNKDDVQGVMLGAASFSWKKSGSTIRPGAICEHFTSFGGVMRTRAGQTPLSEFLRYGAAGASGTVCEPYSLSAKFPTAMIQVHYARGCTLAEAFYQSVYGPYQLLIVGDPLCRPWANIPQVTVTGVQSGATVKGLLKLKPSAAIPGGAKVDRFELFIDGRRRAECKAGETLALDTSHLADGYHELRVVAVAAGPIQSQGRRIIAITTAGHGRKITTSVTPRGTVRLGRPLVLAASSPGSIGIAVLHNSRLLGRINGPSGRLDIDPAILGYGPVRLRAVGLGKGGPLDYVWSEPLEVTVEK